MYALFTKTTNPEVTLPFAAAAKLLQSCLTMCDPTDSSPPGSPVPGTLKARTLESRFYIYIYTHMLHGGLSIMIRVLYCI